MPSRRNLIIRAVATLVGDIAVGIAVANVCIWLIQAAALGLFLSFMAWLLAAVVSLALSQYVVHPAVKLLLDDKKLDTGLNAVAGVAAVLDVMGGAAVDNAMRFAKSSWSRMRSAS